MDDRRARLLFRATGVIPLGVFVVVHVLVNATALAGPATYDRVVGGLARLAIEPLVVSVFVALPLLYHALYGLRRALRRAPDAEALGYRRPRLDLLMRMTSALVLVFVVLHAWQTRGARLLRGGSISALYTELSMSLSSTTWGIPVAALGTIVGLAAVSFHLGYGCHAVLSSQGRADRRTAVASAAASALLFAIGTLTVISLSAGGAIFPETDPASLVPCGARATEHGDTLEDPPTTPSR